MRYLLYMIAASMLMPALTLKAATTEELVKEKHCLQRSYDLLTGYNKDQIKWQTDAKSQYNIISKLEEVTNLQQQFLESVTTWAKAQKLPGPNDLTTVSTVITRLYESFKVNHALHEKVVKVANATANSAYELEVILRSFGEHADTLGKECSAQKEPLTKARVHAGEWAKQLVELRSYIAFSSKRAYLATELVVESLVSRFKKTLAQRDESELQKLQDYIYGVFRLEKLIIKVHSWHADVTLGYGDSNDWVSDYYKYDEPLRLYGATIAQGEALLKEIAFLAKEDSRNAARLRFTVENAIEVTEKDIARLKAKGWKYQLERQISKTAKYLAWTGRVSDEGMRLFKQHQDFLRDKPHDKATYDRATKIFEAAINTVRRSN